MTTEPEVLSAYEVENTYYVRDGIILTHGPYYGEKRFVPHFVKRMQEQDAVRTEPDPHGNGSWAMCHVRKAEVEEYPELAKYSRVGVRKQMGAYCSWLFGMTADA